MKKQLNQLRRFFARTGTRKLNAATAREVIPASYDDDDGSNRLSGAFIVVLVLHVIALVGVFAFSRMKDPDPHVQGPPPPSPQSLAATSAVTPSESPEQVSADPVATPAPSLQYASNQASRNPASAVGESATANIRAESDVLRPGARATGREPYIVKNGDNLTKIAIAYSVRPADLMSANNLKTDEIRPGQELVIPAARTSRTSAEQKTAAKVPEKVTPVKATPATHKVRKNETLVKIARDLGVSYEDLTKLNGIKDPRKLQEGQILKVPKKG
jgi:LysM repeat protein